MKRPHLVAPALSAALFPTGCAGTAQPDAPPGSTGGAAGASPTDGTSMPPWPSPADVADRVAQAGLDLGPMGTAEHYHPHVRIVIDGADVALPPNIGVDSATDAMSPLYTHEGEGTIHIEARTKGGVFALRQLFTEWGVGLTANQMGGAHADLGHRVELRSNGEPVTGDRRELRLAPDQAILLRLR